MALFISFVTAKPIDLPKAPDEDFSFVANAETGQLATAASRRKLSFMRPHLYITNTWTIPLMDATIRRHVRDTGFSCDGIKKFLEANIPSQSATPYDGESVLTAHPRIPTQDLATESTQDKTD